MRRKILGLLPLIAAVSACAGSDTRYPSLAMRSFEVNPPPSGPTRPPAPTRPIVDDATLVALVDRAVTADTKFSRQQAEAAQLARAAAGRPIESDARAAALVSMADLAAHRGATTTVLAELDELAVTAATTFAPTQEIEGARAQVLTLVTDQNAAMERLWEMMET
ncbi:hypothetical protein J3454_03985 [Erythrobacter sp. NFXS35]|uniref:hypothetical protein n=1 Tax=Erythrobacter sp. NFXS35 TaxID=2818436 RepID=UPI0032DE392D